MPRPKKTTKKSAVEELVETNEAACETTAGTSKYKQAGAGTSFDIFSEEDDQEMERAIMAKAGVADGLKSAADIARAYLPLPHMALEWAMNRRGIAVRTVNEFIGEENAGKSSLMFMLMSNFIRHNIPCFYINTEPKMLESDWIARLTGTTDPKLARKIAKAIQVSETTFTLDDMDKQVRTWAHMKRYELGDRCVPFDIPLVIVVDSLTKLLNPAEASVLKGDTDKSNAKKVSAMKGVADVSQQPGVTAKWHHEWMRLIAPFCEKYNVTIFLTAGQNTKMDTSPAMKFSAESSKSLNKTKTGGQATNQSAGLQVTITQSGMAKNSSGVTYGRLVRMRVVKNSYGPVYRDLVYTIQSDKFEDDGPDYIAQSIDMDEALANALVETKAFGFTVTKKRYTSNELGILQAKASELSRIIHGSEATRYKIGSALRIGGYEAINPEFA